MPSQNTFDVQKAIQVLKSKGASNYVCPFCGGRDFGIHGEVATISVTDELTTLKLGNYVPALMFLCNKCGNIQFFSLTMLGLANKADGEEK